MIPYEEAVLVVHPKARDFRPVKPLVSGLFGWTFSMPRGADQLALWYGWVTFDGEVSKDTLSERNQAARNLKTYLRTRSAKAATQPALGPLEDPQ